MLRNFDTDLDRAGVAQMPTVTVRTPAVRLTETLTVTPSRSSSKAHLAKADEAWDWADLRDYVVGKIEARFGVFPRDPKKESGIFKSFLARQPQAVAIARWAFESNDGHWGGAPISVNRFCKASDLYFADVIAARLATAPVKAW